MSSFSTEEGEGSVTVVVEGDLDNETAAQGLFDAVNAVLKKGTPKQLVLDISAVQLINSYGVGKIVLIHRRMKELGGEMSLKNPSKFVKETLSLLFLENVIRVATD